MATNDSDDGKSDGGIDYKNPETLRELYWGEGLSTIEISNMSDVSPSTIRYHMGEHNIDRRRQTVNNRQRQACLTHDGHGYSVWLSRDPDGVQRKFPVHRLLAISKYGSDSVKGKETHHKNGIPWDNRPSNIEILGASEHVSKHKRGPSSNSKLDRSEVLEIDELLRDGNLTHSEIAAMYSVSHHTITDINLGRNWGHVTGR